MLELRFKTLNRYGECNGELVIDMEAFHEHEPPYFQHFRKHFMDALQTLTDKIGTLERIVAQQSQTIIANGTVTGVLIDGFHGLQGVIVQLQVQLANGTPVNDAALQALADRVDVIINAAQANTAKVADETAAETTAITPPPPPPPPAPAPAPVEPPAAPPVDSGASTADTTDANPAAGAAETQTITGADVGDASAVVGTPAT